MPANPPEKRIEISVTPLQRALIVEAARLKDVTVSELVRNALCATLSQSMRKAFEGAAD